MQDVFLELSIGDAIQIGDQILTVVDINDDEICLDLDEVNNDQPAVADDLNGRAQFPPR